MDCRLALLMGAIAGSQAVLAIVFGLQLPIVTDLWPFSGTSPMSFVFIASILLAASASTAWCVYVGSERALAGVALDYVVIMLPLSLVALVIVLDEGEWRVAGLALLCVATLAFGAWLLRRSMARPWRSVDPTPRPVLVAFAVFIVVLAIVGSLLIARVPGILPWSVTQQLGTVFGVMFLGAAAYFAYGLIDRRWENAGGQLAGFLAYDVVLIVPLVSRIVGGEVSYYGSPGEPLQLNLVLYTAVLVLSAVIAVYYLLIQPSTRLQTLRVGPGEDVTSSEPIAEARTADG